MQKSIGLDDVAAKQHAHLPGKSGLELCHLLLDRQDLGIGILGRRLSTRCRKRRWESSRMFPPRRWHGLA